MTTFARRVIAFTKGLQPNWKLPADIALLYPYSELETLQALEAFYEKFYADVLPRIYIFGINPGRFGSGITGVPFTDPIRLEEACNIVNAFPKKAELSSIFVYAFIEAFGGVHAFYQQFYITSLCPLGFTKEGKNYNYYDDRQLQEAVTPHIESNIQTQMAFGTSSRVALCLGEGQNFKYFSKLNDKHGYFEKILPLPHPRWVMQYRRKRMDEFVEYFLTLFQEAIALSGYH